MQKKNKKLRLANNALRSIVDRIREGYFPEKIILFGSLSTGKINASSDIDIMVIKKTTKNPWDRMKDIDCFVDHEFPVDFLVYTPSEIKNRIEDGDVFVKDILEHGKIVYEK
ncbi:hypothetical protein A2230_02425 [candidate division WOR-1 bacterium RIFOXYA2_FULL_36_21]|uniref:Polymerase beta nucleotidyltransferase domain-containing protein n=1 Tax=candidate division WOR-1 bacterium RIFOXYB2_FULL_36_35 TaxID=1802578 RepID=A0A1F4S5S9_UNCSA|nr:MAG: hypothetical protein A2230_02425 [candidate division WOR-1 bacterium RIFOXYA2_FULL_36_21]OGC15795.1 MAG: hypothetical protein A2290_05600 [candidate division WOR-1 bacterium RIFOXYB2_FULL_36_35]